MEQKYPNRFQQYKSMVDKILEKECSKSNLSNDQGGIYKVEDFCVTDYGPVDTIKISRRSCTFTYR